MLLKYIINILNDNGKVSEFRFTIYIYSRKDTQKVIKAPCNTKQHRDLNNLFFVNK